MLYCTWQTGQCKHNILYALGEPKICELPLLQWSEMELAKCLRTACVSITSPHPNKTSKIVVDWKVLSPDVETWRTQGPPLRRAGNLTHYSQVRLAQQYQRQREAQAIRDGETGQDVLAAAAPFQAHSGRHGPQALESTCFSLQWRVCTSDSEVTLGVPPSSVSERDKIFKSWPLC